MDSVVGEYFYDDLWGPMLPSNPENIENIERARQFERDILGILGVSVAFGLPGLTTVQISSATGIPMGSVRSRVARLRERGMVCVVKRHHYSLSKDYVNEYSNREGRD